MVMHSIHTLTNTITGFRMINRIIYNATILINDCENNTEKHYVVPTIITLPIIYEYIFQKIFKKI